ncbi:ATP-binding protein [Fulvivirga lutimaris]|uniref:DNA polymerase III subunit n=1 Tax=Fulvivirga lutimaris TaxID=1819566 RepID=UPI0012BC6F7C|nr:DNA polymerase III subunit delta [Fulvivirga lutimaris]MTI39875.1 DNA polymerase III subunit delta [Fulvivirga lutimaris]
MLFKDIKGLDDVKGRLVNALQNEQVAHAQLFVGKPGSPNLAMALAYTTYLNCENRGENDACGTCPSCSKNAKFIHPDVHYVYPVSATKNVKSEEAISEKFIKEWRSFLTESPFSDLDTWRDAYGGENKQVNISKKESREIIKSLSLKSFEGKYKVMIIWLPEFMHPTAANGILKILEEPPEKTLFILVSNDKERLLTTITSRTQIVTIPQFADEDIKSILIETNGLDEAKASQLAHLADGDLNNAFKLAQQTENDSHDFFAKWMRSCFSRNFSDLVNMADEFHGSNKLSQRSLLKYALNTFRESLLYQNAPNLNRVNGSVLDFIKNFSKVLHQSKIVKMSNLIDEAYYHLERNGSPKMIFLDLSLHIAAEIK